MSLAPEDIVGVTGHPGRPLAPLGEPAQQLRVELASSAGAMGRCQRHIVARWLIDFRDLMLTLDKTLIAMYVRQPYS